MKFYEHSSNYDYTFPAVALAYFLRYPNPYSRHVLSSDVIDRYIDPETGRLHSTRLHLKKSKVPSAILSFLPRSIAGPGGTSQTFVLEKSIIDPKEGWMETESKNMEWTGVLSVVEKQTYRRQRLSDMNDEEPQPQRPKETTTCKTVVTFVSQLGQNKLLSRKKTMQTADVEEEAPKQGLFAAWSTAGIQRTIELVGVKRTKTALINGKEGMNVVLERLRSGGIVAVLEGMRRDRLEGMGVESISSLSPPPPTRPLQYLTLARGLYMYLCPGESANEVAQYQSQSTQLYDVAALIPNLPDEEAFHALPPKLYEFDYAELRNSTLDCIGTIGTDNNTAIVTLFEIATFEALPYESVLPPTDSEDNGRWAHSVSRKRDWDMYRVETAGGTPPICNGERFMAEKEYAAEYWFFNSGGEDLWTPNDVKREELRTSQGMPTFI
ncbi:hypothetical protein H2200_011362 [Cladophialophora chaetospira]|uniref:PRELI/MSF1 domain-containing protein n=1 Tax=Cladophialophora chaetospira TaxID=386627 RepID=A0AA38WZ66_9EURO|nr:hypothetical protein H2200_011362 [Cladophialophora chaetospira]